MNRPFGPVPSLHIDVAHVRRFDPNTESRCVLATAHTLADAVRAGGRLFLVGSDERRSDVAEATARFIHPMVVRAPRVVVRSVSVGEITAHARPGDACIVFARSTLDAVYRTTVDTANTFGMATITLVPGVGVPDGRADHVIGVGSGGRESFAAMYHALAETVHALLLRDPIAA